VLIASQLEAYALTVSPVSVRLHELMGEALKIFDSEFQAKNIRKSVIIEDSYTDSNVDWVMADSSRWSQILVNLLTNASKFCSLDKERREVIVRLAASTELPKGHGDVVYQTSDAAGLSEAEQDVSENYNSQLGQGEPLYIQVMVEDTGWVLFLFPVEDVCVLRDIELESTMNGSKSCLNALNRFQKPVSTTP
jgi:signal transduction histidine kinase